MKKSIFLLLTFMYSAVFAGTWHQTITVINNTNYTLNQTASINTGEFDGNYNNVTLLPWSTTVIKAKAPHLSEGDEIYLTYIAQEEPASYVRVVMFDDVGGTNPTWLWCGPDDYFNCSSELTNDDSADLKGHVIISNY